MYTWERLNKPLFSVLRTGKSQHPAQRVDVFPAVLNAFGEGRVEQQGQKCASRYKEMAVLRWKRCSSIVLQVGASANPSFFKC